MDEDKRRIVAIGEARPGDIAYSSGLGAAKNFPMDGFPNAKVKLAIDLIPHMHRGNQRIGWIFEERGELMFYPCNDPPIAFTVDLVEWIVTKLKR